MAVLNRTVPIPPLLLTYNHTRLYLQTKPHCTLFLDNHSNPLFQLSEPVLLIQGVITNSQTVHLVLLKMNGELSYTLISPSGTTQTTVLANLDVRSIKYRRLILLPLGKMVHIFYAYNHQAIPDLWQIEHRFWDGKSWRSGHLGEVVHPKEPLYNISMDNQGNIHLLTMTFQGRQSYVFSNRFHGTFHIWGSPMEALKIQGEVVDMNALMTSDNVYYLYWITKTMTGQFELRWAQLSDAHNLTSTWFAAPAPIHSFNGPWRTLGVMEVNGTIWLLASSREETLMNYDGKSWRIISTGPGIHRPLHWFRKGNKNFYYTNWVEDDAIPRTPAYAREMGLTFNTPNTPTSYTLNTAPEFKSLMEGSSYSASQVPGSNPVQFSSTAFPNVTPASVTPASVTPASANPISTTPNPAPSLNPLHAPSTTPSDSNVNIEENVTQNTVQLDEESTIEPLPEVPPEKPADPLSKSPSEKPAEPSDKITDERTGKNNAEEIQPLVRMISRLEEDNRTLTSALQILLAKFEENENSLKKIERQMLDLQEEKRAKESALAIAKESLIKPEPKEPLIESEPVEEIPFDLLDEAVEAVQEVFKPTSLKLDYFLENSKQDSPKEISTQDFPEEDYPHTSTTNSKKKGFWTRWLT